MRIQRRLVGRHLCVVKRATTPDSRARLRAEGATLAALEHPGAVDLVGCTEFASKTQLVTVAHGDRTLADPRRRSLEEILDALASVGAIVAELHALGLAHGGLRAEHVLLDNAGVVRLCSFGAARWSKEAMVDDLRALGTMAAELTGWPQLAEVAAQPGCRVDELAVALATRCAPDPNRRRPTELGRMELAPTEPYGVRAASPAIEPLSTKRIVLAAAAVGAAVGALVVAQHPAHLAHPNIATPDHQEVTP